MITLRPLEPGILPIVDRQYAVVCNYNDAKREGGMYFDFVELPKNAPIYEIIETPAQPERDWSDVVERLFNYMMSAHKAPSGVIKNNILCILQQADKPAPVKRKKTVFINFYKEFDDVMTIHSSKKKADYQGDLGGIKRIACKEIEIEYTEGEGLDG